MKTFNLHINVFIYNLRMRLGLVLLGFISSIFSFSDTISIFLYSWNPTEQQFRALLIQGELENNLTPAEQAVLFAYQGTNGLYGYHPKQNLAGKITPFQVKDLPIKNKYKTGDVLRDEEEHYIYFKQVSDNGLKEALSFEEFYLTAKAFYLEIHPQNNVNLRPFAYKDIFARLDAIHQEEKVKQNKLDPLILTHWIREKTELWDLRLNVMVASKQNDFLIQEPILESAYLEEDPDHVYYRLEQPTYRRNWAEKGSHLNYLILNSALNFNEKDSLISEWKKGDDSEYWDSPATMVSPEWCITFGYPYKDCILYENKFYKVETFLELNSDFYLCKLQSPILEPIMDVIRAAPKTTLSFFELKDCSLLATPQLIRRVFPLISQNRFIGIKQAGELKLFHPKDAPIKDYYVLISALK